MEFHHLLNKRAAPFVPFQHEVEWPVVGGRGDVQRNGHRFIGALAGVLLAACLPPAETVAVPPVAIEKEA